MTAFLFISSARHAGLGRRVDLANFASLFGDRDEPPATPAKKGSTARLAMMALLLVGTIGDAVMVARPDVLRMVATSAGAAARLAETVSL